MSFYILFYIKFIINIEEKRLEGYVFKDEGEEAGGEFSNKVLIVIVWVGGIKGVFCFFKFYDFFVIYMYFFCDRKIIFYIIRFLFIF